MEYGIVDTIVGTSYLGGITAAVPKTIVILH